MMIIMMIKFDDDLAVDLDDDHALMIGDDDDDDDDDDASSCTEASKTCRNSGRLPSSPTSPCPHTSVSPGKHKTNCAHDAVVEREVASIDVVTLMASVKKEILADQGSEYVIFRRARPKRVLPPTLYPSVPTEPPIARQRLFNRFKWFGEPC